MGSHPRSENKPKQKVRFLVAPLGKMLIADNKAISIFCFVSDLDN